MRTYLGCKNTLLSEKSAFRIARLSQNDVLRKAVGNVHSDVTRSKASNMLCFLNQNEVLSAAVINTNSDVNNILNVKTSIDSYDVVIKLAK